MSDVVVFLYRPTGPKELELVASTGFLRWLPHLLEKPIFYPVTNAMYAREIAIKWNLPASGVGNVTKFCVKKNFIARYPVHKVRSERHAE